MIDLYLVWSNEHQAWWKGGRFGYSRNISEAGAYTRDEAIDICRKAIPGNYNRLGVLPEVPIRMLDLTAVMKVEQ